MSGRPEERISDYLAGELAPAEREQLLEEMRQDPALRERVTSLESVAATLESLPDEAWETLPRRPAPAARSVPRLPARAPRRRMALLAAAGSVLIGVGVGIGILIERPGSAAGPTVVLHALSSPSAARATARMTSGGRMLLAVDHLPSTAPGRFYELWLMNSDRDLVSVASFRVGANGKAQLNVPLPVAAGRYRYLDISLQQAAAGPAHSGDSVLRAPVPS